MNRPHRHASTLTCAPANFGRFLLVLAAIELISTPLTQYAWTWDHFLHGGTDFESSLLSLVVCLGFLLVLRHRRRLDESLRVLKVRLSLPVFETDKSPATPGTGAPSAFHSERRANSRLAAYSLPLQI